MQLKKGLLNRLLEFYLFESALGSLGFVDPEVTGMTMNVTLLQFRVKIKRTLCMNVIIIKTFWVYF